MQNTVQTRSQLLKKNAMKCIVDLAQSHESFIFGGYARDSITGETPTDLDICYGTDEQMPKTIEAMRFFFEVTPRNKKLDNDYPDDYPSVKTLIDENRSFQVDSYDVKSLIDENISFKIDFVPISSFDMVLDINENGLVLQDKNKTLYQRSELSLIETIRNIINKNFTLTSSAINILSEGSDRDKVHLYYRISKLLQRGWTPKDKKITDISDHFAMSAGKADLKCHLCMDSIHEMFYFDSKCCGKSYHFSCMKKDNYDAFCIGCQKSIFKIQDVEEEIEDIAFQQQPKIYLKPIKKVGGWMKIAEQ